MKPISIVSFTFLALIIALCGQRLAAKKTINLNELCQKRGNLGNCKNETYQGDLYLICTSLLCATEINGQTVKSIGWAPDGTPCGEIDTEICREGLCIDDTLGIWPRIVREPDSEYNCHVSPEDLIEMKHEANMRALPLH